MRKWFGLLCGLTICCGLMAFSASEVSAAQISPFETERLPLVSEEITPFAVNNMEYFAITPLGVDDTNIRSDILRIFGLMGYNTESSPLLSAAQIKSALRSNGVSIIHGHGGPGRINCEYWSNGTHYDSTLYASFNGTLGSNDAEMSSYSQYALSQEKLVIYVTCESAKTNDGNKTITGLPQQTVAKGAKCSIGWKVELKRGGEWTDILTGILHNRVSIYEAMLTTDDYFQKKYSVDSANSPAVIANRLSLGQVSQIIRIN